MKRPLEGAGSSQDPQQQGSKQILDLLGELTGMPAEELEKLQTAHAGEEGSRGLINLLASV
jgi:hypothetical protein